MSRRRIRRRISLITLSTLTLSSLSIVALSIQDAGAAALSPDWSGSVSVASASHHGTSGSGVWDITNGNEHVTSDGQGTSTLDSLHFDSDNGVSDFGGCGPNGGPGLLQNSFSYDVANRAMATPMLVSVNATSYDVAIGGAFSPPQAYIETQICGAGDVGKLADSLISVGISNRGTLEPLPANWDGSTLAGSTVIADFGMYGTVTLSWQLTRQPDRDHDGFPDAIDACPDVPGPPDSTDGCPSPDSDGDGVPDTTDLCPATPPGVLVDVHGCPIPPPDNHPPVAADFQLAFTEFPSQRPAAPKSVNLLTGALDPDGDPMLVTDVSPGVGAAGWLVVRNFPSPVVSFTPPPGFAGVARFNYTLSDPYGATDTATVVASVLACRNVTLRVNNLSGLFHGPYFTQPARTCFNGVAATVTSNPPNAHRNDRLVNYALGFVQIADPITVEFDTDVDWSPSSDGASGSWRTLTTFNIGALALLRRLPKPVRTRVMHTFDRLVRKIVGKLDTTLSTRNRMYTRITSYAEMFVDHRVYGPILKLTGKKVAVWDITTTPRGVTHMSWTLQHLSTPDEVSVEVAAARVAHLKGGPLHRTVVHKVEGTVTCPLTGACRARIQVR